MEATNIIAQIIKRMKFWGNRFPNATTSFLPNTKGSSYYLIQNREGNNLSVQIRLSNHGTYLETWTDRKELGNSIERIDPARSINISIVFVDDGQNITTDCKNQKDCEGCILPICKPQTFSGQNEIGRPFKVFQYVYQSKDITPRYINALAKAIFHARYAGEYIDPLKDLSKAAKPKEFGSVNMQREKSPRNKQDENKQYNTNTNMKKITRIKESELRNMIYEQVQSILEDTKRQRMKGPMNQWFKDFNNAQKVRDIRDYVFKGGRIPDMKKKRTDEVYNRYNELQRFAYENQDMRAKVKELARFAEDVAQIGKMRGQDNYYQFYNKLSMDIWQMDNLWNFLDDDD